MNVVAITGRMTKDPEVRYSQSGTALAAWSKTRKYGIHRVEPHLQVSRLR